LVAVVNDIYGGKSMGCDRACRTVRTLQPSRLPRDSGVGGGRSRRFEYNAVDGRAKFLTMPGCVGGLSISLSIEFGGPI
jgi:hypothetical protein